MTERLNRGDAERVLSRALELDRGPGMVWDRDALLRAAAEVDIDRSAMLAALVEHEHGGRTPLVDRLLGPTSVTGTRWIPAAPGSVDAASDGFLVRNRMTPTARPATWLQQRGTWPNPVAQNSVASVSLDTRPGAGGTDMVISVDLGDLRSGYLLSFMVVVMASVLAMVVLPIWGLLVGAGVPLATSAVLRTSYRRHVQAVDVSVTCALDEIEESALARGADRVDSPHG